MVLVSVLRQTAAKRIPLIKFRRQREEEALAARSGTLSIDGLKKSASSAAAISLPTIEDWQLPNRYRRKPLDAVEIEYINRGGPA
ncbi:uncharacterized protein LOC116350297 [Contarinia nasturtii]|uniref:uncharacterized protein LOC116350297 n=1 Tax=Contarinia nasturtii TaxID=265458 RepID=UPI0012D46A11|nr:uncharacterized protein LOC116350297 [Contarinia nasturtii]XP_031637921.1 uncharacterized protein LOC116350297 [Contarinia nasturtii]